MIELTQYISENKKIDWRGCLMLSMPGDIAKMVTAWSDSRISSSHLADDGREEYTHCTILYGFDQDVIFDDVQAVVKKYDNISIVLGKVKRFPASEHRPNSDCLVIEVEAGPQLRALHAELKNTFDVKTTFPTYNPHVTIAYIKPGLLTDLNGSNTFQDIEILCDKMTYYTGSSENRSRKKLTFEEFQNKSKGGV